MSLICSIIIGITLALAAISKAIRDTLSYHFETSIFKYYNPKFWNPSISWKNKYKNYPEDQKAKFFGSKTFLVWITDAWHLFDMLSYLFLAISFTIILPVNMDIVTAIALFVVYILMFFISFEIIYKLIKI